MPRATVSTRPEHHVLKTLADPEDPGYVDLRRMSYGELLESQDMAFQIRAQVAQRAEDGPDVGVKLSQGAIALFQMSLCVVKHNLQDEQGRLLDLSKEDDVKKLDPRVGQEITSLIDKIHNVEQQYPNSEKPSTSDSSMPDELAVEVASHPTPPQPDSSPTT